MPGTEELLSRLQQLEQGYYGDKEAARQQKFFDTYGARFSNNRGLGLAILNELDARGIDTTAADEAVSQILDQLRTECNEIINSIKGVQEQAIESAQKVETIANVVDQATASNPGAEPPMPPVPPEAMAGAMPPVPSEQPPAEPPVPPEAMAGAMPPVPPEQPPAEPPVPPEQLPPDQTVSDVRAKRVARMKSNWGKVHASKPTKPANNAYKPSVGILSAAMRGF